MVVPERLPVDGTSGLVPPRNGYRLLYVGVTATTRRSRTTLHDRIVYCHVRGRATNSTLRATLGPLLEDQLGTRPTHMLSGNWRFEDEAEKALSDWIAHNAAVSWVTVNELQDRRSLEDYLIESCKPPLNLDGNRKQGSSYEATALPNFGLYKESIFATYEARLLRILAMGVRAPWLKAKSRSHADVVIPLAPTRRELTAGRHLLVR